MQQLARARDRFPRELHGERLWKSGRNACARVLWTLGRGERRTEDELAKLAGVKPPQVEALLPWLRAYGVVAYDEDGAVRITASWHARMSKFEKRQPLAQGTIIEAGNALRKEAP